MSYSIKITGPGLTFEQEVSEKTAKSTMVSILTGSAAQLQTDTSGGLATPRMEGAPAANSTKSEAQKSHPEISMREFILRHEAKRNPDKIAAFALYLQVNEGKKLFNKEDIVSSFEAAAEPVPTNLGRDIRWTQKNGWIASKKGETGTYYLTGTGQDVVENNFPRETVKKTSIKPSPSRRKSKKNNNQAEDTE